MKIDFIVLIQRFRLLIGGSYILTTLLILFGTLMPNSDLPEYQILNYDKIMHVGAFMAWTLATGITWRAFQPKRVSCLLYTSPSPRDITPSRMPSSA